MQNRNFVISVFVLASLILGNNVEAKEITGAEINQYAEKAQKQVPVQIESKANLVQYKIKDTGGKLELEQENIKVEIPKNISEPVVLKGKEQANTKAGKKAEDIKITIPQAKGSKVTKEKNGVVGYESKDNFTNLVEPTKDGIRLMTVIENKNAPERYEYKLDIKGGYVLTESFGEDGKKGIAVLTADQSDLIAMIDVPWAKDGSGKDIETYYEIKGNTIVQIVKHKVKGTVYPVSADPQIYIYSCINYIQSSYADTYNGKTRLNARPTVCGRALAQYNVARSFHDAMIRAGIWASGNEYWSMYYQWQCHAKWGVLVQSEWNVEASRPVVSEMWVGGRQWNSRCNPS